jgi:hypothetical protein
MMTALCILNYIQCNLLEVLTLLTAVLTLVVAFYIPRRITVNQIYADFVKEYRSAEIGGAVFAIFDFFVNTCKNKVENIHDEYIDKYNDQIKNNPSKDSIDYPKTLHFQRRLVSQFYFSMAMLRYEYRFPRLSTKNLKIWMTPSEVKLLDILLYMAKPASEVFERAGDLPEPPEDDVPMNRLLYKLYEEVEGWE